MWRDAGFALAALVACAGGPALAAPMKPLTIGVAWPNLTDERWTADEAAIREAIGNAGGKYLSADAMGSPTQQAADVQTLVADGAHAIVIVATDPEAVLPAAKRALAEGVAVIAYGQLMENPEILTVAYDAAAAGRLMAKALMAAKPAGAYAFVRGPKDDPHSDLLSLGVMETLKPAMDAGKIKVGATAFVAGWRPDGAMGAMQDMLGKTGGKIDAVVAESDAMAGGVVAALSAQGLAGVVGVAGADGDHAAINRVAQGAQTVSVWEDGTALGRAAGAAAVALAKGKKPSDAEGAKPLTGPKGGKVEAVLLEPLAITRANLGAVVDEGWMTKAQVCSGVKAGTTPFCG